MGLVDVVLVAARDGDDVAFVLADAAAGPTSEAVSQPLVAVQASATVELHLRGHRVPAGRPLGTTSLAQVRAGDTAGLRVNGSLALGLVRRCAALVGPSPLDAALEAASGSAAARAGSVAERTAREAVFLLVSGSRPAIRAHLLDRFGATA